MECRDTERLIDVWLDGELATAVAQEVEAHLADCGVCRSRYGPMVDLLRSPDDVIVPEGLRDRILAAVDELPVGSVASGATAPRRVKTVSRTALRWVSWGGAIAASVAFFVMGWVGSRWFAQPQTGRDFVDSRPPKPTTVVLSPGLLNSMALAVAWRSAANPMVFVAQAAATDSLIEPVLRATPADFQRVRPTTRETLPDEGPTVPEVLVLPPVIRSLGA